MHNGVTAALPVPQLPAASLSPNKLTFTIAYLSTFFYQPVESKIPKGYLFKTKNFSSSQFFI
jgi:hypothetical protein